MNRAFDNGILPINSFGNGWYNGPFGPLYDMGMDSDKILMVADIYKDSQGFTQNLLGACALPWQDPPDVAVDSTGIFTITPNDRTKGSSSESTAIMNGIALRTFTKYSAVNNGLGLSNKDMMSSIINSTRIANNTVTKNACFGYGKVDECALRSYIERNYPNLYTAPTDHWFPTGDGQCGNASCNPFYVVYAAGTVANPDFNTNLSMRNAFREKCNLVGGFVADKYKWSGLVGYSGTVCFTDSTQTTTKTVGYIYGIAARDSVTHAQIFDPINYPGGYRFSAWPDGVPH
jgi:hypothetical protein